MTKVHPIMVDRSILHHEKQVPVSPKDGMAPISIADFAVPEKRLAIYVDGAAFHVGERFRWVRWIREKLRNGNPPWKVVELRAEDLKEVGNLLKCHLTALMNEYEGD